MRIVLYFTDTYKQTYGGAQYSFQGVPSVAPNSKENISEIIVRLYLNPQQ